MHANLKDGEAALRDFTRALELDPRHGPALENRAILEIQRGEWTKVVADATAAIEIEDTGDRRYVRGGARERLGDLEGAKADYQACVRAGSRYAPQAGDGLMRLASRDSAR